MVESISSLETRLTIWEYGEYASAAIVIIGVVGEFLADFSNAWGVRDDPRRKDRVGKLSTLVLIAGLAAELICLVSTNMLSGRIIVLLGNESAQAVVTAKGFDAQIASANLAAAEAKATAESERVERVKLEAAVAPRSLSLEQQRLIAASCERFRGHRVLVSSYGLDGEGAVLAGQIISVLRSAGISVADGRASVVITGGFETGVHVRGPEIERDFVSSLGNSLSSIGKLQVRLNDNPPRVGSALGGGGQSFPPGTVYVTVAVGIKPVPVLVVK